MMIRHGRQDKLMSSVLFETEPLWTFSAAYLIGFFSFFFFFCIYFVTPLICDTFCTFLTLQLKEHFDCCCLFLFGFFFFLFYVLRFYFIFFIFLLFFFFHLKCYCEDLFVVVVTTTIAGLFSVDGVLGLFEFIATVSILMISLDSLLKQ